MKKSTLVKLGFVFNRSFTLGDEYIAVKTDTVVEALNEAGFETTWGNEGSVNAYATFFSDIPGQEFFGKNLLSVIAEEDQFNEIIFLQDSNADEAMSILDEHGEEAVAKHLSQWDNGDSDNISEKPFGSSDTVVEVSVENAGDYTLAYNTGHGYISLSQKVEG